MSTTQERYEGLIQATAGEPLPGPLAAGVMPQPIEVCGLKLRPMVASDIVFLKRLGSPIIDIIRQLGMPADQRPAVEFDEEQTLIAAWWFNRPASAGRHLFSTSGKDGVSARAMSELGDALNPFDLAKLKSALAQLVGNAISTFLAFSAPPREGQTFTQPPGLPTMASDGFSKSSGAGSGSV